jgi:endonuclease YncB( thermonuclease family)
VSQYTAANPAVRVAQDNAATRVHVLHQSHMGLHSKRYPERRRLHPLGSTSLRISGPRSPAQLSLETRGTRPCGRPGSAVSMGTWPAVPVSPSGAIIMLVQPCRRTSDPTRPGTPCPGRPTWRCQTPYAALFHRAVDGDTLIVLWQIPPGTCALPDRIRLAGVDAPEMRPQPAPGAIAARDHLARLCSGHSLAIVPVHAWPDRYGRLVARIYDDRGRDLCNAMIQDGYATDFSLRRRRRPK